jgi:hypothetical protein
MRDFDEILECALSEVREAAGGAWKLLLREFPLDFAVLSLEQHAAFEEMLKSAAEVATYLEAYKGIPSSRNGFMDLAIHVEAALTARVSMVAAVSELIESIGGWEPGDRPERDRTVEDVLRIVNELLRAPERAKPKVLVDLYWVLFRLQDVLIGNLVSGHFTS